MEPFTHAFSSLALARAGQKRLPRLGTAIVVVAGLAPDLDYASYFGGASAFMRFHRTAMHSLAGAALTACAIAAAFCVLDRRLPPKKTAQGIAPRLGFGSALAASVVGIAGHVLLDLASGMGVQLLWPFRARWWAWDLARNFDPWVLFLLVAGLLVPILFKLVNEEVTSGHKKRSGAGSAILTLSLIAAYFGARAHLHREAVDLLLSREYHGRVGLTAEAFPKTATPFIWRGIVTTDNTLEEVEVPVNQPDAFDPNDSVTLYKPEDSPALEVSEKSSAAAKYLEYARVPIASVRHNEAGYRVEVRDARFPLEDDDPANIILRIELSSTYQIRKEEFLFPADANR